MFRNAFAALAAALLGACASLGHDASLARMAPLASTVVQADLHAICALGATSDGCSVADAAPWTEPVAAALALERRRFSPPSRRQPDQRPVFATASDRAWRVRRGRALAARRRRRAAPQTLR
jgi:hypothetical protein